MAVEIMSKFGITDDLDNITVDIRKQFFKIDILLIIKGKNKVIIIEDKTDTSEHSDQINRYRNTIYKLAANNEYDFDNNVEITTVYFKTGFFDDFDELVKTDFVINGNTFFNIIKKYPSHSEILDSYIDYLRDAISSQAEHGKFYVIENDDKFTEWNISKYQIAQQNMMRYIFPAEKYWQDKDRTCYIVDHGVNRGGSTPWTELTIINSVDKKSAVFWRIDTNNNGIYISLRFYNKYNKMDEEEKAAHIKLYNSFREFAEKIITENDFGWQWSDVKGRYTGNYSETSLITFNLNDSLKHWNTESKKVAKNIRTITELFNEHHILSNH